MGWGDMDRNGLWFSKKSNHNCECPLEAITDCQTHREANFAADMTSKKGASLAENALEGFRVIPDFITRLESPYQFTIKSEKVSIINIFYTSLI